MRIKKYIILLFTVLLSFIFITCSSTGRSNHDKILYWSSNNTDEIAFAKYIVDKWNAGNPDNQIKFQPVPEGQSSEEVILAAVVGETTPSLYSNMWQGDVELYARAGKLVALDSLPGFMDYLYARCDSDVVKEITSTDGHIYQIPWKINPIMMIYNVDMFNSIGYTTPPATYSQFLDAAKKLKRDKDGNGYIDQWIGYIEIMVTWWQRFFDFYPFYLASSNGGHLVANNKAAFNNEAAIGTFKFIKTLFDNNFLPRERLSARRDPFLGGDIATRFTGPWEIAHAEKFKPAGFHYNFAPLPVPDGFKGRPFTYGDTKNIVIFKTCPDVKMVWAFLKLMISPENDLKFLEITNQLPRRKDLLTNPIFINYFDKNKMMKPFAEQAKFVKGPDNCEVLKEVFDLISQQYEACVVYGKKTPKEAIEDASKSVNLLLLK